MNNNDKHSLYNDLKALVEYLANYSSNNNKMK